MLSQLTTSGDALRLFFTDDVYLIIDGTGEVNQPVMEPAAAQAGSQSTFIVPAVTPLIPTKSPEPIVLQTVEVITTPEFKFLGNNKRNILILVNDNENEVSDEKGRELLRKIVKSVNLTASDFALLNYAKYKNASFTQLIGHFSSVVVFSFGVSPESLGLSNYPQNTVVMEKNVMLIFSAELRKLEEDQQGKKVLWGSLKKLGL